MAACHYKLYDCTVETIRENRFSHNVLIKLNLISDFTRKKQENLVFVVCLLKFRYGQEKKFINI